MLHGDLKEVIAALRVLGVDVLATQSATFIMHPEVDQCHFGRGEMDSDRRGEAAPQLLDAEVNVRAERSADLKLIHLQSSRATDVVTTEVALTPLQTSSLSRDLAAAAEKLAAPRRQRRRKSV